MESLISSTLTYGVPTSIVLALIIYIFSLRRIVPTNVVHIVQRGSDTVSYGVGKGSNVYYAFPKWLPKFGVEVRELPVSNFDIDLPNYSAYDKDRVPFAVDVKAFFHIADTNKAAEKVASFQDLKLQLNNIVQGSVRSILAKSKLEEIMEERSIFGNKFTESVREDLKNNKFTDILSSKGGSAVTGLIESLGQTPEGKNILSLLEGLKGKQQSS